MLERTGWADDQGSGTKDYRIVEGSFRVSPMTGRLPLLLAEKMKGWPASAQVSAAQGEPQVHLPIHALLALFQPHGT